MNVFISVGMRDRAQKDIENDIREAARKIRRFVGECEIVDNFVERPVNNTQRLYCLGEAIKKIGECDACFFVKGWEKYNGCMVERAVCQLYGIQIIDE